MCKKDSCFTFHLIKIALFLFFVASPILLLGQPIPDSLKNVSLDTLFIRQIHSNEPQNLVYANALLYKAKQQRDTFHLIAGYHVMALLKDNDERVAYSDSIIQLSKEKSDAYYPTTAYLIKGAIYYRRGLYKDALDNYLLANKYAQKHANEDLIYQSNYCIIILKNTIGEFGEALKLERENHSYVINNRSAMDHDEYLSFIFAIATSHYGLKALDSASYYNTLGISESKRLNRQDRYSLFLLNEGVVKFKNLQYKEAYDSIIKAIPLLKKYDVSKTNLAIAYYHLGKLNYDSGKDEPAIDYLKKVDTIFRKTNDLHPEARGTYELLINYYKKKNDLQQQLNYIEQLLKVDSIINTNNNYITRSIVKEYDIPKLEAEKKMLIEGFNKNKRQFRIIIFTLALISLLISGGLYYQYNRQKLYKGRFEKLLSQQESTNLKKEDISKTTNKNLISTINVPEDVINTILTKLNTFETQKEFTELGLTSQILAKKLKTNSKYLSLVINHFKEQTFITYLNNLRIEHTIERLKSDFIFRKYTVQAISKEVGFNNPESFSKAFYKKTGIKPSFFMKELEKKKETS